MEKAIHEAGPNDWQALPIVESYIPLILPNAWRDVTPKDFHPFCKAFLSDTNLQVIVSVERKNGGDRWLHVSASKSPQIPSWEDLKDVKDLFIGKDKIAIQIFPKADEYVNFHPYVLHLWSNLEKERFVPDFRRKGML